MKVFAQCDRSQSLTTHNGKLWCRWCGQATKVIQAQNSLDSEVQVSVEQEEENPVLKAMQEACYREILPHLSIYEQTQDPQETLILMQPYYYRGFYENA